MEVTYNFVNEENVSVLVDERFRGVIMQLDKELYNNNHKETLRHQSSSEIIDETNIFVDKNIDIKDDFINEVMWASYMKSCQNDVV